MAKESILVVDDEATIVDVTRRYLEREGYEVTTADDGKDALAKTKAQHFDLIVTDIMMPEMNGYDFVLEVLDQDPDQPFLFITAKTEERDRLYSLTIGADDYVTKPFSPRELVLRIKNILHRVNQGATQEKQDTEQLSIGPLMMNAAQRQATIYDNLLPLTNKEFDLLWLLASDSKRVFSKTNLYQQVWDSDYLDDANTLNVHIHDLREKMQQAAGDRSAPTIKTVWGIGYRLEEGTDETS